MLTLRTLSLLPFLYALYYLLDTHWLPHQYVFSPAKLQELSKQSIALHGASNNTEAMMEDLVARLQKEYPRYVQDLKWDEWMFNNAGSAMGAMVILHASITEYLILFGTPLGTSGHSGVHAADDYFTILTGSELRFLPGEVHPTVFLPGDQNHLPRGRSIQYMMPEGGCWALELAQGWIPAMLPFGLVELLTSTMDAETAWKTTWFTARHMGAQMLQGKF
ncbi:ERG2 and sigma1 receptor-like protein [Aulographum hederae CBS 113979]|uniref:C-8 sterol isomerase n=1 Tax=Aulographum hederae CBS 113979 TaxID=1176131 RepID=A0A6G1HBP3_9PEZI|nr:ERG2 and sigma1 receptor-like protein [Aulographum hederae CBS 113979]